MIARNESAPGAGRALTTLTVVNYLNYIDRYILAAVLGSLKLALNLSDTQAGLLVTAFLIPYMFTSPLFGWMGDNFRRPKILAAGAAIWSIASLLTGAADAFILVAAARFLLGIGESAFTTVSISYISDWFNKAERGRKIAIFASALPVGAALGYVAGGYLDAKIGWRGAFYTVGFPGLLFAVLIWRLGEPRDTAPKSDPDEITSSTKKTSTFENYKMLLRIGKYRYAVLGYCAYAFVVGGIAHWIPSYIQRQFSLDAMKANMYFGGIAVLCGLTGTLFGGWYGDRLRKTKPHAHLFISAVSMLLALPLFLVCVCTNDLYLFLGSLAVTQFLFFISTSPITVAVLESAPAKLSTTAMALAIFACHILGDAISAPIIGVISDNTGSLRTGILCCAPMILICAVLWFVACRQQTPQFKES